MTWIDAILSRIADLWPFVRIQAWQIGVRTTYIPFKGVRVEAIGPGPRRCLWWFESVIVVNVQERGVNLLTQSLTTADDVAVCLAANFTFEVEDAMKATLNVHDYADSLEDLAMMHLSERIREWKWDELRAGQKELERSLKGTLTTRAKDWGVKILRVGLTDLVKARQYRFFGDPVAL
jgi:regulator of protease activity HflC (stomatin/prohibitin superfamily)